MATNDFDIDSRNKLGANVEWETGNEFDSFVDALNRGLTVRSGSVPGEAGAPADIRDDALALSELRLLFSRYQ